MRAMRVPCIAAVAIVACSGDGTQSGSHTVRDSAGVTIIEARLPENDRFHIEMQPVVSIGQTEGEEPYLLSYVRDVLLMDDGRILIADGSDRTIRIFDANGVYAGSFGGSGQGPGELSGSIQSILLYRGDSIAVAQSSGRPIHIFDGSGRFGRSVVPQYDFAPSPARPPSSGCCRVVASFPDGGWLVEYPETFAQEGELRRGEAELVRVSAEGEVVAHIGTFPGRLRREATAELRRIGLASGVFSLLLQGDFSAAVNGEHILVGGDGEYRVDELDPDGRLVRSLRIDAERTLFPAEDQQSYAHGYRQMILDVDGMILPRSEAIMQAQFEHLPDRVPAYGQILTDPAGRIWLVSTLVSRLLEGGARALVLDGDGDVLANVRFPPGFAVRQIGRDRVVGVVTDSMGVARVMVHRVVAAPGPG